MPARLFRKLLSFFRYPGFTRLWFLPVFCLLGFCRAAILLLSFRRVARFLGRQQEFGVWVPLILPLQEVRARKIRGVIDLAAAYTPWESNCFSRALAASVLLRIYGVPYVICFGLAKQVETAGYEAHAWTAAGRVSVTGGRAWARYSVVGCFASRYN
jgi:hypothetical protein